MAMETWHEIVAPGDAESVKAQVRLGSGELNMSGGAEALLDGTFTYAVPEWKPEVAYEVQGGLGQLVVQPPEGRSTGRADPKYVWDLQLGGSVPVALSVKLGSGSAALDLLGPRLSKLDAKIGSGQVSADLSGDHPDLERIDVASGSGRLGLILNGGYEALKAVELKNASGITDVSMGGTYEALERVRLSSASGNVAVGAAGQFPKLDRLDVKVASGTIDLNLSEATWETLNVSLDCVSGKATVEYPGDVGVFVRFSSVTGRLDAPGLVRVSGGYATPNYGEAVTRIKLSMSTVSGRLMLQPTGV